MIIWLTGRAASGKTTTAYALAKKIPCIILDGDELRAGVTRYLGYTKSCRREQARTGIEIAKLLSAQGYLVIVAMVTAAASAREMVKKLCPDLHEIAIAAPESTIHSRKCAREARGISFSDTRVPYETPKHPALTLDTGALTPEECADTLLAYIQGVSGSRWTITNIYAGAKE